MLVFAVKTQFYYLTTQLHVSAAVSSHNQTEYKNIKGKK